ncbi:hypothetical protein AB3S75_006638 [Citrus x aurantiifolia]
MSNSSTSKATWNPQTLDVFCDLCIKEVDVGHRPGTHLTSQGYENLIKEFTKEIGLDYNRTQMKNKWDSLRTDWKLWKNLIGKETGLRWNYRLRTIDASEEWWEKKIKENPQFSRFRKNGIDPELEKKINLMFMNTVATGEHVWVPSSGFPLESNDASESFRVESTVDSDEYIVSDDSKGSKGKRVALKGNKVGGAVKLSRQLDRLIDAVEKRNTTSNSQNDTSGKEIYKALEVVASLPNIEAGSKVWLFPSQLFTDKVKRDLFNEIKDPNVKLKWLNYEKDTK